MRPILIPTLTLATALVVPACRAQAPFPGAGSRLSVVAVFYPVQEAAQRVGGDLVSVTNLTAPGVEPHDLELTPGSIEEIQSADVVLYLGDGFQPAIQEAVAGAQGVVVDLLAGMPTVRPPQGSEPGLHVDPHVWLDPPLYARMVRAVQQALSRAAPEHAAAFTQNANAFVSGIMGLDRDYRAGLAHCARTVIVTNHAAFGYLAADYGLTQEAISGLAPDAEPSAERIAQLKDLVQRDGITTVFTEDLVSPKVAQTLASEAGVKTQVLHTLEGLTTSEVAAGQSYETQMRDNLTTLEAALDCS